MNTFSFRGITKDYLIVTKGLKRPTFSPIKRNILTIPSRPGGYLQSTETNIRTLSVPVLIQAENYPDLQKVKEDLAEWLLTEEEEELILPSEEDRVYYAAVDGSLDLDELVELGEGVITFICPDPYKYSYEKNITLADNTQIHNSGTAQTYPVFTVEMEAATTFLDIISDSEYMRIGQPAEAGQSEVDPQTLILHSDADNLTGWTNSATVLDGEVSGTLKTDGNSFYTDDYGTGSGWHGPAMKTSLSEVIQDFSLEVILEQRATASNQIGRVMVELLDASNNPVARLQMWRRSQYSNENWALFEAYNSSEYETIFHKTSASAWTWKDFYGMLRISRKDNEWEVYVAQVDKTTGEHNSRDGLYWTDSLSKFTAKVSQVIVHIGTFGTYPGTFQWIGDVKVYKINNTDNAIPFIAQAGDTIVVDHQKKNITINGQNALFLKDFGATFFPLKKGTNTLQVNPNTQTTTLKYRERFL